MIPNARISADIGYCCRLSNRYIIGDSLLPLADKNLSGGAAEDADLGSDIARIEDAVAVGVEAEQEMLSVAGQPIGGDLGLAAAVPVADDHAVCREAEIVLLIGRHAEHAGAA